MQNQQQIDIASLDAMLPKGMTRPPRAGNGINGERSTLSVAEIIERFIRRFPEVKLPDSFYEFLVEQERIGHTLRRHSTGEALYDFLARETVEQNRLQSFLTSASCIARPIDYRALLRLKTNDIFTYLVDHLAHVFDYQQVALDSEHDTGFNTHGTEHVSNVTRNALSLVRRLNPIDSSELELKAVAIGGLMHDIGNLLQRKFHGLYGVYLLTQLFRNYDYDEQTFDSFLVVLEVVMFHEVEFGTQQALFDRLHQATLSVIVADKTDVSFRRVSSKSNVPEAMQDMHVLVNLLVANSRVKRKADSDGGFRWTVDFSAKFDSNHSDLFSRLLKATGRVKYPKEWTDLYEESNIEYLFVFQSTFLRIYLARLYLAIRAVFTLYPSVQHFELVVDDAERGISLKRIFDRANFRQQITRLGKLFYREQWATSYLAKVLE